MKKSFLTYSLHTIFALGLVHSTAIFANPSVDQTASNVVLEQPKGFSVINSTITKSPTDKAIYQGIRLENGMEVLLISDEKANKSLMSVGLPIGSMEDPIQQQGLAHYLEHMILMGSKDFPETNSLDGFLTKNGGYNNAYTASDRTVYYLEVNNNAFDEAVARLSDAFAQPLLSEKNAKKEVNAVNAEMVRAKSNDAFLMHDVNLATANPNHPITKFAVGNNITLSDKKESKLQDELVKFYQQHYSANLMKAVLYSNQPIEKLAKLAEQNLGKVKNKNLSVPVMDMPFFREEDKGVIIDYKPVKPNKMLVISFDMPEDKAQFKHKTGEYLAYVFNNNSEGTLSDYLIKEGLSDSGVQSESSDDVSRNRGDFTFYIDLTDKGLEQKEKIISLVFQQINKIKQAGVQPSYFNELKESLNQAFEHLQTEKNGGYVAGLVSKMMYYPLENVIDVGFIVDTIDNKAIERKLAEMTIENVRIMLVNDKAKTDHKTKYFEAPYAINKITSEQKTQWLDFSKNPELKLPVLNPYFAADFSLNKVDKSRKIPMLIEKAKGTEIYAMGSQYFADEPKAIVGINFTILPNNYELKNYISASLLNYMSELEQANIDFQSTVAGIETSIDSGNNGLIIGLSGYTQNLAKLLKDKLKNFSQFKLKQDVLSQAKQHYLEALDKQEKENALRQANSVISNFKAYPYFEVDKERKMIEAIQLDDIEQARQRVLTQATGINVLSLGNFTDEQVKEIVNIVEQTIKYNHSEIDRGKYIDINQSQRKLNYIKQIPHEDNALTIAYFPNNYQEIDGISRASLLQSIISRWYFDDLRTDKQLGYVVYATTNSIGKTSGLQFLVQSPTVSAQEIMVHNQRFFMETLAKLKVMSAEDFEKYRSSLIKILERKPESLSQEFANFVSDAERGNDKFDHKIQVINTLKQLKLQDIIDFYQQAVIDQKGFVFASQAIGINKQINQPAELKGFEKITSIEELQQQFERKSY